MEFYSTKNKSRTVGLMNAVLNSLPDDNGLYMPVEIPVIDPAYIATLNQYSFQDIAITIAKNFLSKDFSENEISELIHKSINFPAPLITLEEKLHVLELWHGPSLAFKDFGARFMAEVMSALVSRHDKKLTILVATSGDTGGAVGAGFLGVDNIEVIILYPSGKVSPLQEKQLTTLGQNISAVEISGTFDDCQSIVKKAFLDNEIKNKYSLSSANSINIARLIPQSFYYFEAYKQLIDKENVVFCVPSGNFGNLTAGIIAKRMGLPIEHFIAATNCNDVVPTYLSSGIYKTKKSIATISNAMDVGAPSNFQRIQDLYNSDWNFTKSEITGFAFDDEPTRKAIIEVNHNYNYTIDPHGAVGYLASRAFQKSNPNANIIILETAHPAKFLPVMTPLLGNINIPTRLSSLADKQKHAYQSSANYEDFKRWLIDRNS